MAASWFNFPIDTWSSLPFSLAVADRRMDERADGQVDKTWSNYSLSSEILSPVWTVGWKEEGEDRDRDEEEEAALITWTR